MPDDNELSIKFNFLIRSDGKRIPFRGPVYGQELFEVSIWTVLEEDEQRRRFQAASVEFKDVRMVQFEQRLDIPEKFGMLGAGRFRPQNFYHTASTGLTRYQIFNLCLDHL